MKFKSYCQPGLACEVQVFHVSWKPSAVLIVVNTELVVIYFPFKIDLDLFLNNLFPYLLEQLFN